MSKILIAVCCVLLMSCAPALVRSPVPQALLSKVQIDGLSDIRFWGDSTPENLDSLVETKLSQIRKNRPELLQIKQPAMNFLTISGGGSDGAFGSGLLNGWTASGKRPEFEIVTGVSTGALSAPFAFLGQKYDEQLKEMYTKYSTDDFVKKQVLAGLLGGEALASNAPLFGVISKYVDKKFLTKIAIEHERGRRLYVGTTNLDAERPVIWDMGRIAASGHPQSLDLFRKILLASAAIPGAFPPVRIQVTANGKTYDELHVDGGTSNQVFLFPTQTRLSVVDKKLGIAPKRRLYIIRNSKLTPEWKPVEPKLAKISKRSISSLIKTQGIGDLIRLYGYSKQNRINYNLASVPSRFDKQSKEAFDTAYMRALYGVGYSMAAKGYPWSKSPPGFRF